MTHEPRTRLALNLCHFGRLLRKAGLPVGPGAVLDAVRTVAAIDIHRRDDFYWALHAVFVKRRDQHEVFHECFQGFWRDPFAVNQALSILLPRNRMPRQKEKDQRRRVAEAWQAMPRQEEIRPPEEDEVQLDAVMTAAATERLQTIDFEQMSTAELEAAKDAIARMDLSTLAVATRRYESAPRGRIDLRATLRTSLRSGGADIPLRFRRRKVLPPPMVVFCDISGSMGRYSRMLLHFMHALTNERSRVHSFVFGTRFTNVTRALRHRDVDDAFAAMGADVDDWSGGTRIGQAVRTFNLKWSRRVLGQGAVLLLITDGLDRDDTRLLTEEMDRLHKSCRRVIWLNPLLRYDGFEPLAKGVQAILSHVDEMRPVHNLNSLRQLAEALGPRGRRAGAVGQAPPTAWVRTEGSAFS